MNRLLVILVLGAILAMPLAHANPIDNQAAASLGGERLLEVQLDSGAMPWIVGDNREFQNVQGITGLGFMSAFQVTGNLAFLGNETSGAQGVRDWIVGMMDDDPQAFSSSSNAFFLSEYARFSGNPTDYEQARRSMNTAISRWGSAENIVHTIVDVRANLHGWGNLGVWDVALYIRAAQEVGYISFADQLTVALLEQDIVDLFDNTTNAYELGLSGLLFGLAESGMVEYQETLLQARDALLAAQCPDGSFGFTWQGVVYCEDPQTTAYAVIGLTANLEVDAAQTGCDFLVASQAENGGWDLGGYEVAEVNAEAVVALQSCILPHNNGVTSYSDMLVRGSL